MNWFLQSSRQTAVASVRFLKRGKLVGHLVPFLGSTRKLTSFSPIQDRLIADKGEIRLYPKGLETGHQLSFFVPLR